MKDFIKNLALALLSIEIFVTPIAMAYAEPLNENETEVNKQQITFERYQSKKEEWKRQVKEQQITFERYQSKKEEGKRQVKKVEYQIEEPEVVEEVQYPLTRDEIELIAQVTMAEAEGEPEEGQRLVIDTILNRVDCDKFDDTVEGVIYAEDQFSVMTNGRFERCSVQDKFVKLVEEELLNRTNSDVLFFRASYYHSFGTPVVAYGNTYFSTY